MTRLREPGEWPATSSEKAARYRNDILFREAWSDVVGVLNDPAETLERYTYAVDVLRRNNVIVDEWEAHTALTSITFAASGAAMHPIVAPVGVS